MGNNTAGPLLPSLQGAKPVPRLRRRLLLSLLACLLALGAAPGRALAALDPPLVASDNVKLLANLPEAVGAISLQFSSNTPHAYVSTLKAVLVYDIANPVAPRLVGVAPLVNYQNEAMSLGERPNGDKFLIIASNEAIVSLDGTTATNNRHAVVVEVTDPTNPKVVGDTPTTTRTHTISCGTPTCEYAYSDGRTQGAMSIIDLRNFRNPKMNTYRSVVPSGHDEDLDDAGILWHVGGQGSVALDISKPRQPVPPNSTDADRVASDDCTGKPYNNFIHHNSFRPNARSFRQTRGSNGRLTSGAPSLRRGNVFLVTEEDYLQISPNVGQCGDYEGSFQTWHVPYLHAGQYAKDNPKGQAGKGTMRSLDRWNTELLDSKTTTPTGRLLFRPLLRLQPAGLRGAGLVPAGHPHPGRPQPPQHQAGRLLLHRSHGDVGGLLGAGAQRSWSGHRPVQQPGLHGGRGARHRRPARRFAQRPVTQGHQAQARPDPAPVGGGHHARRLPPRQGVGLAVPPGLLKGCVSWGEAPRGVARSARRRMRCCTGRCG